jgi:ubiquitin C-terminal hydrolase
MKTVDASLQSLVAADQLTGSNQYLCEFCDAKTDADRMFCIRKVPPCLRVNLSRFVFDIASNAKQKVLSPSLSVCLPVPDSCPQI